jgi:hypothetical protein
MTGENQGHVPEIQDVTDFEKNRHMSRISGNVSLDFCIMQVILDYS